MFLYTKIKSWGRWWRRYRLDYISLFLLMILHYGRLHLNNYFGDGDAFYHAQMSLFLRRGVILKEMPWMQFSSLKENFTDHQFIYHLLLAPFTYIHSNPLIGIKVATVLFAALMVLSAYWLFRQTRVIWPWFFAALLASSEALTFRLNLIKVNSLSLIVTFFLIYALIFKKIKLIACLAFIFVWLYAGWPLAIFITGLFACAEYIYRRLHRQKIRFAWYKIIHVLRVGKRMAPLKKIFLSLTVGLGLGLLFHPYWPHNLYFYWQQFVQIGVINLGQQFPVGTEWYSASLLRVISYAPLIFITAFTAFVLLSFNLKRVEQKTWFAFLATFAFLLLTIKSRRYAEYYIPLALIFSAFGFSDLIRMTDWPRIKKIWSSLGLSLRGYLILVGIILITLVIPGLYNNLLNPTVSRRWTMEKFARASQWLKNNTPPQSVVFHNMWDDWSLFFYHNDQNYYIIGLDPTFMYNYDRALTEKYFDITLYEDKNKHYRPDQVANIISQDFNSRYVVVEKSDTYQKLIDNLRAASGSRQRYEDEETVIFELP